MILSIENHCSIKQQKVMAEYMISIFDDKLYVESVDEKRSRLPSPADLKMKILIKVFHQFLFCIIRDYYMF